MNELIEKQKKIIDEINAIKKRYMPFGYCIDLDALENVELSKAGKKVEVNELLELFFTSGILVSRGEMAIKKIDDLAQFQLNGLYNQLQEVCEQIQAELVKKTGIKNLPK